MSAECQICGADLVVKEDGRQECPECPLKMRIAELEAQVEMFEQCEGCDRTEDHNRLLREENERLRSRDLSPLERVALLDLIHGHTPVITFSSSREIEELVAKLKNVR